MGTSGSKLTPVVIKVKSHLVTDSRISNVRSRSVSKGEGSLQLMAVIVTRVALVIKHRNSPLYKSSCKQSKSLKTSKVH